MSDMILQDDLGEGIARVTLNRAPVNALNPMFLAAIADRMNVLTADDSVRAVVLVSPFKVFSAGVDLKEAMNFSLAEQTAIVDGLNNAFAAIYAFPKPVVTAATGSAIAGGLFFLLAADHVVAAPGAQFGLAEVRVGVNFPVGALEIARATLSSAALNRMMLSGLPVSAERARELGFVDEIAEREEVLEKAVAAVKQLASSPPKAYAAVKAQIRKPVVDLVMRAIEEKSDPVRAGWFTDQTVPAMKAMIAGRG